MKYIDGKYEYWDVRNIFGNVMYLIQHIFNTSQSQEMRGRNIQEITWDYFTEIETLHLWFEKSI